MPRTLTIRCDRCGQDAGTGSRIGGLSGDLYAQAWRADLCPQCCRALREFLTMTPKPIPTDEVLVQ
jgi:hypothetical protein